MKHGQGRELAERLYINDGLPFVEIGKLVGRDEKTIRRWSSDGNWPAKRDTWLATRENVHTKLYKVVDRLADKVLTDCNGDQPIDPSALYALAKIADKLQKLRTFEGDVKADGKAEEVTGGISEEAMQKIEQRLKLL